MKRYERIDELVEKLSTIEFYESCGLTLRKELTAADMASIDTMRAENERRRDVIDQLRDLHKDLVELKELTGVEFRLREFTHGTYLYSNSDYIFNLAIPSRHHLKAQRSLEVVTSNPDEVERLQHDAWEELTSCEKLKVIIETLEGDKTLSERIAFLEEELGE